MDWFASKSASSTWLWAQADQLRPLLDLPTMILLGVVLALLGIAYGVCQYLRGQPESAVNPGLVRAFSSRVRAWWLMYAIMGASLLLGSYRWPAVLLFFGISFWALREFITLTPARGWAIIEALFWVFFVFAPLQYVLVWMGEGTYNVGSLTFHMDRLFTNLIPVYAFLFIPARVALAGDHKRFLERTAKIQAGLLVCVFALSHAPALLNLQLISGDQRWERGQAGVLLFLILAVQMGDAFQYLWSHLVGQRVIAPAINASKTWEGLLGGVLSATLIGMGLWWVTPFTPVQAGGMAALCAVMGFAGSLVMSAVERDRGVKDYGTLVEGHVGVLDRFDSICFAAPVFYHVTRFFFT